MRLAICPYMLRFREPAITSRETLTEKPTYLLKIWDERNPLIFGIGEAAVFPGLSPEADHRYEYKLIELLANIAIGHPTDLSRHSSIQFGLEQALRDFASGGQRIYFDSPFTSGEKSIEINGLVWMGDRETMHRRLEQKINQGFKCVKLKIGALAWPDELSLIREIRTRFSPDELTVRVDANGAFRMENVFPVLAQLADLGVHSIEQPIPARNPELMKFVCRMSPVPVALDEDLIGIASSEERRRLLDYVRPAYIVLKPALCGGFSGASDWIEAASGLGIGWWITSALESNVGLNAIAQYAGTFDNSMPQGLGTGGVYTNNFSLPIRLDGDRMRFLPDSPVDDAQFISLDWKD